MMHGSLVAALVTTYVRKGGLDQLRKTRFVGMSGGLCRTNALLMPLNAPVEFSNG